MEERLKDLLTTVEKQLRRKESFLYKHKTQISPMHKIELETGINETALLIYKIKRSLDVFSIFMHNTLSNEN